ncbi:MAG: signal peptidase II [Lactobacillaceae bacterium]|nr:signal peptidase II [Lactobacillaceae bacterium]
MLLGLSIAAIILILDQMSKYVVYDIMLAETNSIAVVPFFNIIKAWNTGVSFSMFDSHGVWGVLLLSLLSLAIVAFLIHWLYKEKSKFIQTALGFIIGGAIGNVIDRVRLGAVFDFLDVYVGVHHWPTFNVADSFICIGAFMIIFHSLLMKKQEKAQ